MKTLPLVALLLMSFFCQSSLAATTPDFSTVPNQETTIDIQKLKPADVEKMTGRKMNLIQKLKFKLLQKKLKKFEKETLTKKQENQAVASLVLGLFSLLCLFIPFAIFFSIPAAILAIIFGAKSLKGNSNAKGIIGIVSGGLTLILLVVAIIVLAAAFSGFRFE